MRSKKLSPRKATNTLSVEVNKKGGFTLWITTSSKIGKKNIPLTQWLLDGSMLKDDLEIRLGTPGVCPYEARYDSERNSIKIVKVEQGAKH